MASIDAKETPLPSRKIDVASDVFRLTLRLIQRLSTTQLLQLECLEAPYIQFCARMVHRGCPLTRGSAGNPPASFWKAATVAEARRLREALVERFPDIGIDLDPLSMSELPGEIDDNLEAQVLQYNKLVHVVTLLRALPDSPRVQPTLKTHASVTGRLALGAPNLLGFNKEPLALRVAVRFLPATVSGLQLPFECWVSGESEAAVAVAREEDDLIVLVAGERSRVPAKSVFVDTPGTETTSLAVRSLVEASEGRLLLSVDFAQIELRLLAHFSDDSSLIRGFHGDEDFFVVQAATFLAKKPQAVTAEERAVAKRIMYALLYGAGPSTLAKQLALASEAEAVSLTRTFFRSFPTLETFLVTLKETVAREKEIVTLGGRRVRVKAEDAYKAASLLCQSSAAEIMKRACVSVERGLQSLNETSADTANIVLQIHDELLVELKEDDLLLVKETVVRRMTASADLQVPLRATWSVGRNWHDMRPF